MEGSQAIDEHMGRHAPADGHGEGTAMDGEAAGPPPAEYQEQGQALHVRILLRNALSKPADSPGSSLPDSPGQVPVERLPTSPAQEARERLEQRLRLLDRMLQHIDATERELLRQKHLPLHPQGPPDGYVPLPPAPQPLAPNHYHDPPTPSDSDDASMSSSCSCDDHLPPHLPPHLPHHLHSHASYSSFSSSFSGVGPGMATRC